MNNIFDTWKKCGIDFHTHYDSRGCNILFHTIDDYEICTNDLRIEGYTFLTDGIDNLINPLSIYVL